MQNIYYNIIANDKFTAKMQGINQSIKNTQQATEKMGKAMQGIGLKAGLGLLGIGKVLYDFREVMNGVGAASGASAEEMKLLEKQALNLGKTTLKSSVEAAQAQQNLARAGFSVNEVLSMTPSVLNLAIAGATDMATASEVMGIAMKGFNLDATESERVMNVLALASASGRLQISDFSIAMGKMAPYATSLNASLEETTAMFTVLKDAGFESATAGEGVGKVMNLLAGRAGYIKKEFGVSTIAMLKNGKTVTQIMQAIQASANKMHGVDVGVAFKEAFGAEYGAKAKILAENSKYVEELTNKYMTADGVAKKMAETQSQDLVGAFQLAKSAFVGLLLTTGGEGGLEKQFIRILNIGTKFSIWLSELSPETLHLVGSIAILMSSLLLVGTAFKVISFTLGGLGLVMPVITGLIKGMAVAWNLARLGVIAFRVATLATFGWLMVIITGIVTAIALLEKFFNITDKIKGAWEGVKGFFTGENNANISENQVMQNEVINKTEGGVDININDSGGNVASVASTGNIATPQLNTGGQSGG